MRGLIIWMDNKWMVQYEKTVEDSQHGHAITDFAYVKLHPDEYTPKTQFEGAKNIWNGKEINFDIVEVCSKCLDNSAEASCDCWDYPGMDDAEYAVVVESKPDWGDVTMDWIVYCTQHIGEENHIKYSMWLRENYEAPKKKII